VRYATVGLAQWEEPEIVRLPSGLLVRGTRR
jgi:hypothetical protein